MRRHLLFLALTFIAFLLVSVVMVSAADKGCNLQGSWISYENGVPTWMAGVHGQSASSGTNILEYPAAFPWLVFPDAVGMTPFRGAWERTGGNTFDYTFLAYAYDAYGGPMGMVRISGDITLATDCNTGIFTAIGYVYPCAIDCSDPYGETSIVMPIDPSTGYRVMVE
jgi:hypothetical protein